MIGNILIPALAIGAIGLFFGALLGFASIVFKIDKDERIDQVAEILPGANCGGCGFTGCGALAEAIVTKGESATRCNLITEEKNRKICELLGTTAGEVVRKKAFVHCCGTTDVCNNKYDFTGIDDCLTAFLLNGGPKSCEFGCMGLGSCVSACEYDALSIQDGIAKVDREKCFGCGKCANACPKNLIEMIPEKSVTFVNCSSKDKGALVKNYCTNGCIACKICEKKCEFDAIHVVDNIAVVDYDKCTGCGTCAEACPKKVIKQLQ